MVASRNDVLKKKIVCGDFQGCLVAELVDTLSKTYEQCLGYS